MKLVRRQLFSLAAAALGCLITTAAAQNYPVRPVRVIVPFAPGGPTDVFGRLIAQKLSERLGGHFYVENMGGAGGNIGIGQGAKAPPDGYTLVVVPPNIVVNPALFEKVPYDPYKDFEPVTLAVTTPDVLSVHPSVPATNVKELVDAIKRSPGKYSFASPGTGTPGHLVGEDFRLSLGLDLVHIPFNSAGLAIGSTIAGHTLIAFTTPPPVVPQVKDGKLRALAVASKKRVSALAEVPTMAEAGSPGIEGEAWFAVIVPTGTPKEIIALLNREIVSSVVLPDFKEKLAALGFEPVGTTPEECATLFRAELEKWGKVIRAAGIKAQ
jgi:tripartite-type tricarboxylate transporter receptor subunit TctC